MPLREFIDSYPSQVALLGIQFLWTSRLQEALSKGKKTDKQTDLDKKKKDNDNIMKELTAMCLDESIKSKLIRTKVETLVTIQVYQRDKFDEIISLVKTDKLKDENDFDWLKNTRCYWKVEEATLLSPSLTSNSFTLTSSSVPRNVFALLNSLIDVTLPFPKLSV